MAEARHFLTSNDARIVSEVCSQVLATPRNSSPRAPIAPRMVSAPGGATAIVKCDGYTARSGGGGLTLVPGVGIGTIVKWDEASDEWVEFDSAPTITFRNMSTASRSGSGILVQIAKDTYGNWWLAVDSC